MKKLLLISAILAMAVPAGADVLIYNLKQSGATIGCDWGTWEQWKETETSYIIIEPNSDSTAGIWEINVWKFKDKSGQTTKYAEAQEAGEVDFIQAQTEKKLIWIISAKDANNQTLLTGQAKLTKVGDQKYVVAASLAGYGVWDESEYVNERDLGIGKITLKLNTKFTAEAYMKGLFHGAETMDALLEYLVVEEGYVEVTP